MRKAGRIAPKKAPAAAPDTTIRLNSTEKSRAYMRNIPTRKEMLEPSSTPSKESAPLYQNSSPMLDVL